MDWNINIEPEMVFHVLPVNDFKPHIESLTYPPIGEPYSECECLPKFQIEEDRVLVIHNSFDGRENFEHNNDVRRN